MGMPYSPLTSWVSRVHEFLPEEWKRGGRCPVIAGSGLHQTFDGRVTPELPAKITLIEALRLSKFACSEWASSDAPDVRGTRA